MCKLMDIDRGETFLNNDKETHLACKGLMSGRLLRFPIAFEANNFIVCGNVASSQGLIAFWIN